MSASNITIQGFRFFITGTGFARRDAEADFEQIVSRIAAALESLPFPDLARLHSGSVWTDEEDFAVPGIQLELTELVQREVNEVLASWKDTSGVMVDVHAIASRLAA